VPGLAAWCKEALKKHESLQATGRAKLLDFPKILAALEWCEKECPAPAVKQRLHALQDTRGIPASNTGYVRVGKALLGIVHDAENSLGGQPGAEAAGAGLAGTAGAAMVAGAAGGRGARGGGGGRGPRDMLTMTLWPWILMMMMYTILCEQGEEKEEEEERGRAPAPRAPPLLSCRVCPSATALLFPLLLRLVRPRSPARWMRTTRRMRRRRRGRRSRRRGSGEG
jgi:hypothetical protein